MVDSFNIQEPLGSGLNSNMDAPQTASLPARHHDQLPPLPIDSEDEINTPPNNEASVDTSHTSTNDIPPKHPFSFTKPQRPTPKMDQWHLRDPYHTHFAKKQDPWDGCFRKVRTMDDEMCRGWREEIDTLLIFAGLFSATVTAFAVESYQWLQESASEALARLQLQDLLDSKGRPAFEEKGPNDTAIICINTFWFASLTISLASVVVSILCKQWLYEYQRYENLTGEQSFLIRDLRYKGLRGWRVPMIISTLPLLLQMALVLFLLGLLVLLWSLDNAVASIVSLIVGTILIFLVGTSLLPSLQYWFPIFDTQCAYKSSQSWLLFLAFVAWQPDDSWVSVDLWEATNLNLDNFPGLWQFYESFSNSVEAIRDVYHCLLHTAPSRTTDFVRKLENPTDRRDSLTPFSQLADGSSARLSSLREAMKGHFRPDIYFKRVPQHNRRVSELFGWTQSEYWAREKALSVFLGYHINMPDPQIFNRYAEHCVRLLDNSRGNRDTVENTLFDLQNSIQSAGASIDWDNAVASHLIRSLSSLFAQGRVLPNDCVAELWDTILASLITSHRRRMFDHTPYMLLDAILEWLTCAPDIRIRTVRVSGLATRLWWAFTVDMVRMTPLELEYTRSLARYVVGFCEKDGILDRGRDGADLIHLRFLRPYIDQPPAIVS